MKKNTFWAITICLVALFVISVVLTGCKEGPAGPAGASGKDASIGALEGYADSIKCATCHNVDTDTTYYMAARVYQWEASVHATGGHSIENSTSCEGCHTTEGYVKRQTGLAITVTQNNSTPPGCFACHSPHARGDFSLRTVAPQTLLSNVAGVSDYTFDFGKGNLCASCHQPRPQSTKLNIANAALTNDSIVIPSRWDAHHGVQSQLLSGHGGYEWPGYDYTPTPHATASLLQTEGCPQCHMTPATGNLGGGHTMILEYTSGTSVKQMTAGCLVSGCHSGTFNFDYASTVGGRQVIERNLDTLKKILAAKGWIDTVAGTSKAVTIKPSNKAGAVWNYLFLANDKSNGIHNAKYANALLRASITEIRKP